MAKKAKDEGVAILNEQAKLVTIDSIQPHPENPRQGDVGAIYESMQANGFYGFIVAQLSTGNILVGSHRWKAAKECNMAKVPVVYVDVDDDRARRIMLADNRTNDAATYDNAALAELLQGIINEGGSLGGTGFDGDALDDLLFDLQKASDAVSAASSEPPVEGPGEAADVKMVQLFFSAGEHEKFIEAVERLMVRYETGNLTDTVHEAVRREDAEA